jgi:hypothetical protein
MRALLITLLAFVAAPALAQEAPQTPPLPPVVQASPAEAAPAPTPDEESDPLADLITQSGPQTTDEEEPVDSAPPAPHRPTILPIPAPEPSSPAGEAFDADGHAIPQGSYVPTAEAYDLRIKSSILAAQGLQGPMDGGWAVMGPDGRELYTLQLADPAGGSGPLEGAWRDVRRTGGVGSTGLIDSVDRSTGDFVARFAPRPGQLAVINLRPDGTGDWSGVLVENGGQIPIFARRVPQATLPPGYAPAGRGPVIWPTPRPAVTRVQAPVRPAVCSTKGKKGKALKAAKAKCAAALKKGGKAKGKATAAKGKKGAKGKAVPARKGKATAKKKKR